MKLKSGVKVRRQKSALKRLENQLKSGHKNITQIQEHGKEYLNVPLTEQDKVRINKEIETLKSRI